MRVNSTEGENQYKCWLTPDEIDTLIEAAKNRSDKHHIAGLLGSKVGLRAEEMTQITPADKHRTESGEWRIRVPEGKDTTGEHAGKTRDAYLPAEVERELLRYKGENDLEDDEPYLDVTQGRVRQIVREAAREVGQNWDYDGREEDWKKVSSHDLRRYFAQTLLVREGLNPRVVMSVGGWDSFEALKPYLNAPTPEVVDEEFEDVEL